MSLVCTEKSFTVFGRTIAARFWPNPQGRPLLALHGWLDNAATFDLLAPLLAGYQTCAIDFAGHGRSNHLPPGVPYSWFLQMNDAFAVADQLGWAQFTLVGHSMGAHLGLYMAAAFPERIDRLVLIDAIGHPGLKSERIVAETRQALERLHGLEHRMPPLYENFEAMLLPRMKTVGNITEAAARMLLDRGVRPYNGGLTWSSDSRLRYPDPARLTEEEVQAFIQAVEAPTLLILGEQGWPWSADFIARRTAVHRNLQKLILPGGHHLHLEDSAPEVAQAILDFLGRAA